MNVHSIAIQEQREKLSIFKGVASVVSGLVSFLVVIHLFSVSECLDSKAGEENWEVFWSMFFPFLIFALFIDFALYAYCMKQEAALKNAEYTYGVYRLLSDQAFLSPKNSVKQAPSSQEAPDEEASPLSEEERREEPTEHEVLRTEEDLPLIGPVFATVLSVGNNFLYLGLNDGTQLKLFPNDPRLLDALATGHRGMAQYQGETLISFQAF